MVYSVPPSKASIKQNVFEFTLPGDESTYTLPKMEFLSSSIRQRLLVVTAPLRATLAAGGTPTDAQAAEIATIQREMIETYCPGLYEKVTDDQLADLINAWRDASAVDLGESSASASS